MNQHAKILKDLIHGNNVLLHNKYNMPTSFISHITTNTNTKKKFSYKGSIK